jgi:hypothetical protein
VVVMIVMLSRMMLMIMDVFVVSVFVCVFSHSSPIVHEQRERQPSATYRKHWAFAGYPHFLQRTDLGNHFLTPWRTVQLF